MKNLIYILLMALLFPACIREDNRGCGFSCRFDMQEVPYVIDGSEVVEYRPYDRFTNSLNLLAFRNHQLISASYYDYEFCKDNRVIPFMSEEIPDVFLFVANLHDHKAMKYTFKEGRITTDFSILDHREPPTYLVAILDPVADSLMAVNLKMLVARLEIEVLNPLPWMDTLQIVISDVAETISDNFMLTDTTYIVKRTALFAVGEKQGWLGVNTFASYPGKPALLNISFIGESKQSTYLITDEQLNFRPHTITSLRMEFDDAGDIKISISVNGKWEVVDEGKIEI